MTFRQALFIVFTSIATLLFSILPAAAVPDAPDPYAPDATTISASKIVIWADAFSCNGFDCSSSSYARQTNDCANLVSQSLHYGGFSEPSSATYYPWYYHNSGDFSPAWVRVFEHVWYEHDSGRGTLTRVSSISNAYTAALPGDPYVYYWGDKSSAQWEHMSVEAGYGTYESPYAGENGGSGDYVDQHTTDRYHSPWNWGYLHPLSTYNRSKMEFWFIKLNGVSYG